jgi:hypothetical protein
MKNLNSKYEAIKEISLNTLEEFEHLISIPFKNFRNYGDMFYRGHAENKWHLTPSLFREENIKNTDILNNLFKKEYSNIKDFTHKADNIRINLPGDYFKILNTPLEEIDIEDWKDLNKNTWLELLTIGQHYGLKTRFLDFSKDPLIALYFAAEGAIETILQDGYEHIKNNHFCVWAIDSHQLYIKDLEIKMVNSPTVKNDFLNAQKGVFLTPKNLNNRFNDNELLNFNIDDIIDFNSNIFAEKYEGFRQYLPFVYKFNFPYTVVGRILWDLRRKNISYYTLRPHLENIQKDKKTYDKWFNEVIKKYSLNYY